jgi:hypothetical protein
MNCGRNECQRISRRVVLTGTALALGAAAIPATVSQTAAQVKIRRFGRAAPGTASSPALFSDRGVTV